MPATDHIDPQIWCFLPSHLLESCILTKLPAMSVLRFRSVCRTWKVLPEEARFRQIIIHGRRQHRHNDGDELLIYGGGGACLPFLNEQGEILYMEGRDGRWRWIPCPMHCFPTRVKGGGGNSGQGGNNLEASGGGLLEAYGRVGADDILESCAGYILEASGSGLLLLSRGYGGASTRRLVHDLFVCNPITKQCSELKSFGFSVRQISAACIDFDHRSTTPRHGGFTVVVAGYRCGTRSPSIQAYDSKTQSWRTIPLNLQTNSCRSQDDEDVQVRGIAIANGTLFLAISRRNSSGIRVVSCDGEKGSDLRGEFGVEGDGKFHCFGRGEDGGVTAVVERGARAGVVMEIWQKQRKEWSAVKEEVSEGKVSAFATAAMAGGYVFFSYYDVPVGVFGLGGRTWKWIGIPEGTKHWMGTRPLPFHPTFLPTH